MASAESWWSEEPAEPVDDLFDPIYERYEFGFADPVRFAAAKYLQGRLGVYIDADIGWVHVGVQDADPGERDLEGGGHLDRIGIFVNRDLGAEFNGRVGVKLQSGQIDLPASGDYQSVLVAIGEPAENDEGMLRWVPSHIRRIWLMPFDLFRRLGADVIKHPGTGEIVGVLDDGELDFSRLTLGGFAPELLCGELPRDVVERIPGAMDDIAYDEREARIDHGACMGIGDVAPLFLVMLHPHAVAVGSLKFADQALQIRQMRACPINFHASVA